MWRQPHPGQPPLLRHLAGALAITALALLLRAPIASIPLERDEGEYAYMAQRWLHGEVPYADSFEQKPPGAVVAYALILFTVGQSPAAIHWGTALLSLVTLLCTGLCARRLGGERAGWLAAVFLAFILADRSLLGQAANTEVFLALFASAGLLATLWAVERPERGALRGLAAGALLGAAILCKPVAATSALFCLLYAASLRRAAVVAAQVAGIAFLLSATAAWFAAHGALRPLIDSTLTWNLRYVQAVSWREALGHFLDTGGPIVASVWPMLLLALVPIARPVPGARFAAAALVAALLGVAAGGHFREHYFFQAAPLLALLAALALAAVPLRARDCAGIAAACVLAGLAAHPGYWLPGDPAAKSRDLYGANQFPEAAEAGRLINAATAPGDAVLVLGSEPELLFAADRPSAMRYIVLYPLTTGTEASSQRQAEAIAQLRSRPPPRAIVTVFQATSLWEGGPGIDPSIFRYVRGLTEHGYHVAAVAPFAAPGLVSGDAAAALWRAHPLWYGDRPIWTSLAVWLRD